MADALKDNETVMDKLKMHSPNFTEQNIARLAELFPNCITEATDESGEVRKMIDFDELRQELSGSIVDGPRERYHLDWPGKQEAMLAASAPIAKTLRPCRDESVDFDTTRNLFIEGDNLDALKLLQEAYLNKVKMIYIDPPYNTGKQFIYDDDFAETSGEYFVRSNQKDDVGNNLIANTETNGRRHSDWLSMMYARLRLARNLLRDDGVIFASIDDHEAASLRRMCDEIFGEQNFLAQFVWNTEGNTDNQYKVKVNHEYIIAYYKSESHSESAIGRVIDPNVPESSNLRKGYADNNINKNSPENPPSIVTLPAGFPCSEESLHYKAKPVDDEFFKITEDDKYISDQVKTKYEIENNSGLPVKLDDMVITNGKLASPCRIYVGMANKNKLLEFIANDCKPISDEGMPLTFYINRNAAVRYRKENESPRNILSVLRNLGTTEKSKTYLKSMGLNYDYPKPVELLTYLTRIGCEQGGIVMDFFAGSCTTAEAVFRKNVETAGQSQFVIVQLPEEIVPEKKTDKAAYEFCRELGVPARLTEIGKERIRRAGVALKEANAITAPDLDIGFRVLKVDTSNLKEVYYAPDGLKQADLLDQIENVKEDRTPEDLLFQVLLDWGVDLSLPIAEETIEGKTVFFADGTALAACFDKDINEELVKTLAARKPLRAVFRDSGYGNDSVKINVEQIFKLISPSTEVKSI